MLAHWFRNQANVKTVSGWKLSASAKLLTIAQCVRTAPLPRPDAVLRKHPLQKVMGVAESLTAQVLFHPHSIYHKEKRRRCFCGIKSEGKMGLCDSCNQWYHYGCLGMTFDDLEADKNWKCGYCRGKPDSDGICEWKMTIPQGKRKRKKVAPSRHFRDTPLARGVGPDEDDLLDVGPHTWDDTVAAAQSGGKRINAKMLAYKKRAEKLVEEGGHHIVDEMGAAGLQARDVDQVLVNDLLQEQLLGEDDGSEGHASDNDEPV